MIQNEVKFRRISPLESNTTNIEPTIPFKGTPSAAGFDLTATYCSQENFPIIEYGTGICIEIPEGHCGLLFPRSSICKYDLTLANSVGVIDSDYRGEIIFKFRATLTKKMNAQNKIEFFFGDKCYKIGDKIGQIVIVPVANNISFVEVDNLSSTQRDTKGFGSTGV